MNVLNFNIQVPSYKLVNLSLAISKWLFYAAEDYFSLFPPFSFKIM